MDRRLSAPAERLQGTSDAGRGAEEAAIHGNERRAKGLGGGQVGGIVGAHGELRVSVWLDLRTELHLHEMILAVVHQGNGPPGIS